MKTIARIPALALFVASQGCISAPDSAAAEKMRGGANVPELPHPGEPVANLPFARGRVFGSLDEYLAFLRKASAYDVPAYREVALGIYEVMGRRAPGIEPKRYTRRQLLERFGFTE